MRWRSIVYSAVMIFTTASCSAETTGDGDVFRVQISGESHYQKQEPVLLRVSFSNETTRALRLLRWGTPLESTMTRDSFEVIHNGQSLPYIGRRVKRGPPQDADYVLIEPARSVSGMVDLGTSYALDQAGEYSVRLRPQVLRFRHATDIITVSEPFVFSIE